MKRHLLMLFVLLAGMVVLSLGAADPQRREQVELGAAKLIIEFNETGQDVGIQVFLDGDPWKNLAIVGPDGRRIFDVNGKGNLRGVGLTELFAESHEPELADLPLEEFLALFPAGEYQFTGKTVEGDDLVGAATLTHNIPAGPSIVSPLEGEVVDPANAVISWEPGPSPPGVEIAGYEVIVELVDPVTTDAIRVLDINKLPAGAMKVTIPPEFLEPGTEYLFEVLAIEVGGNQTITESSFSTQ